MHALRSTLLFLNSVITSELGIKLLSNLSYVSSALAHPSAH